MAGNLKALVVETGNKDWLIHTCATNRMISNVDLLLNKIKLNKANVQRVYLPNGENTQVSHIGSYELSYGETVSNVIFIPDFKYNLLLVPRITKELNSMVSFYPNFCILRDLCSGRVKGIGKERDGLYLMLPQAFTERLHHAKIGFTARQESQDIALWHRRLGLLLDPI
ncbi:hypothetical protein RDI58_024178 [Solanum bulbocastanum]|uniref:Retrovirus-related Pol polyprotein from transposon TNT 1-94-like beta-barrel domain-containing protein n=1 Tax=Solanum bulbocastanum TaxID=147425 RepID=A0AAN8Y3C6_SOLBU